LSGPVTEGWHDGSEMGSQGKWKQWYRNGLLWKVETVVLKWAGQGKLKQWYRKGLLWKVETVVLKWAGQGS